MKKNDKLFLNYVLDSVKDIEASCKGLSMLDFEEDKDVRDATLRRLEVIGEAVKNVSDEIKRAYPEVEWKKIAGTREVIIHAYFSVDWNLVWDIVQKDIKELKKQIKKILGNLNE